MEEWEAQMTNNTNQFLHWNTSELVGWVEVYSSIPQLQTIHNINTYFEALEELNRREMIDIAN